MISVKMKRILALGGLKFEKCILLNFHPKISILHEAGVLFSTYLQLFMLQKVYIQSSFAFAIHFLIFREIVKFDGFCRFGVEFTKNDPKTPFFDKFQIFFL